jgi:two-component system, cell cycle response regulator DivK
MRRGTRRRSAENDVGARTILIIEDQADQREMYASYFAAKGFRVLTARDGLSALRLAFERRPDVIVTDLSIPHLDGWETTRRLKNDPRTAAIPIIACSGRVLGGAAERALVAGCVAYVAKPCLPRDLFAEVLRVLARAA